MVYLVLINVLQKILMDKDEDDNDACQVNHSMTQGRMTGQLERYALPVTLSHRSPSAQSQS